MYRRINHYRLQRPIVGFLSRFQPEKGLVIFLKAAEKIRKAIFLAVGEVIGDYRSLLGENVILTGVQPRELLPLFYNSFDLFCFPSLIDSESFGMTVLDAMACGVVPIVTDFDGPSEVVGEAGAKIKATEDEDGIFGFVANVSISDLVDKINFLLEDEQEKKRLSELARQRSESFSWDNVAKRFVSLFEELKIKKEQLATAGDPNTYEIKFLLQLNLSTGIKETHAACFNISNGKIGSLRYSPSIPMGLGFEEALCLSLLRLHSRREVKAILHRITNEEKAKEVLTRVDSFIESIC